MLPVVGQRVISVVDLPASPEAHSSSIPHALSSSDKEVDSLPDLKNACDPVTYFGQGDDFKQRHAEAWLARVPHSGLLFRFLGTLWPP